MGYPILPFGSSDSRVIFQHSLKTRLTDADVPAQWTGAGVGSDALGYPVPSAVDAGHGHWPVHDSELGMKQVSDSDGSTETGYRLVGGVGDADLISMGHSGMASIEIEVAAIDAYSATYNTDTYQPASQKEFLSAFSGAGNDNVRFAYIASGTTNPTFYAASFNGTDRELNRSFAGDRLDPTTGGDPKIYEMSKNLGRFVRLIWMWNGNWGRLGIEDPERPEMGPILGPWGRRDKIAGFAEHFNQVYLAGVGGSANTLLTDYYIRNFMLVKGCPNFALSGKCPKVIVSSDSMFDLVEFGSERAGGMFNGPYGIDRAFHAKGLRTEVVGIEHGGAKIDNSVAYTPSSVTSSGTTVTIVMGADPGWQTNDVIALAGITNDKRYNTTGKSITRVSSAIFQFTADVAPVITTASGTITAGRSMQVSLAALLDKNPDAAVLVIHGLTNDLNSAETAADSLADYKLMLDKAFAYDNIKGVICVIPPARLSGGDLDLQEQYNSDVFPALASYVASTYPTKAIEFADVWTSSGGRSPDTWTLDTDNIHYAPFGASCLHDEMCKATTRLLGNI